MPPPFRAEHMGSLLRPDPLLAARASIRPEGNQSLTPEQAGLPSIERTSISEVVQLQKSLGFQAVTSGEFTRTRFWGKMWDEFEGTTALQEAEASMFRLYHPDVVSLIEPGRQVMPGDSVIATGKLRHDPKEKGEVVGSNLHELRLVQASLPKEEWGNIKLTVITPAWFHMRYKKGKAYSPEAYSDDESYFHDVAQCYASELNHLYHAGGLRNVQFDDPGMAYFCSPQFRSGWASDPDNQDSPVDSLLTSYIQLYNSILRLLPRDLHTGIHLCRGNFIGGRHFSEGAYDVIAEKLFSELEVNTFYLEYDDSRSGSFEPLRFLPADKNVVLGVVSTKLRELEDKEKLKERVMVAADCVAKGKEGGGQTREEALKRICVSPQCGFSTHESGYPLSLEDEKKKLGLVRQVADEIWGEP